MSWKSRALKRAGHHQHLGPRSELYQNIYATGLLLLVVLCTVAQGQTVPSPQANTDEGAYRDAISAAGPGGDVLKLERYASSATGQHRKEALAWLVWTYKQIGDSGMAVKWAQELQRADPGNALALATLANADQQITRTSPGEPGADQPLSLAKQALRGLDHLFKPEGMTDDTFARLKTDLARSLNGAVGYAYFQRHDYVTARSFLRKAVAFAPDNAQYTYALALTDLEGRNPDSAEGFKMLARAVNLTKGTPAGQELATYARSKYRFAGGSDANWDGFLAATRITPPPEQMRVVRSPDLNAQNATSGGTSGTVVASQQPAPPASLPATAAGAPSSTTASQTTTATAATAVPTPPAASSSSANTAPPAGTSTPASPAIKSEPIETAKASTTAEPPVRTEPSAEPTPAPTKTASAPAPNEPANTPAPDVARTPVRSPTAPATTAPAPSKGKETPAAPALPAEVATVTPLPTLPPRPPLRVFAPDQPVSLGILIETATTSPESRANVINTLTDMVRRLREKDEAFLVSFSNEVVFEQDLTNNAKSLEQAMDRIKPLQGTALFDAVAFAAGHLKRIAANQNRVLLVISDGSNNTNTISPLELSGEITMSGVKIFCIGMQAATAEDQQRLTALANATGGQAVFLGRAGEFRGAAREVAAKLGIPF